MLPEQIRTLAFDGIGASYNLPLTNSPCGPALQHAARIIHVSNLTNQTLVFAIAPNPDTLTSFVTTTLVDNFIIPASGFILLDISSDSVLPSGELYLSQGSEVFVRALGTLPTAGSVWMSVFYGRIPQS